MYHKREPVDLPAHIISVERTNDSFGKSQDIAVENRRTFGEIGLDIPVEQIRFRGASKAENGNDDDVTYFCSGRA